jgi:hypothetical protein
VERSHRAINAMIGKLVDKHSRWSDYLDYVAFAYNSTVHKTTGFTPNFLHFGQELANSVNLLLANPTSQYESYGEFATGVIERMSYANQLARETLDEAAMSAKRYYDRKVNSRVFEPGDTVLVYNPRRRKQQYSKWQRFYSEEAKVISRVNDVTYIVQMTRSRQSKVTHIDKLKLLHKAAVPADSVVTPADGQSTVTQ